MPELTQVSPEFKQALLETIEALESTPEIPQPLVFKWSFPEKPNWQIALGFRQVNQEVVTEVH